MIKNILEGGKPKACLNKLIKGEKVILDPDKIKEEVITHFKSWTKRRNPPETLDENWNGYYEEKENINPSWYEGVIKNITMEETLEVLSNLPSNKATGRS